MGHGMGSVTNGTIPKRDTEREREREGVCVLLPASFRFVSFRFDSIRFDGIPIEFGEERERIPYRKRTQREKERKRKEKYV